MEKPKSTKLMLIEGNLVEARAALKAMKAQHKKERGEIEGPYRREIRRLQMQERRKAQAASKHSLPE